MKKLIIGLLFFLSFVNALEISVGDGKVAAKPIAVTPLAGDKDQLDFLISKNLKQSGVFSPISPKAYKTRPNTKGRLDLDELKQTGANYVVIGRVTSEKKIQFVIVDTFQEKSVGAYTVGGKGKTLRQAAHEVSDIILSKLTGTRGAFATRLAYILETGSGPSRRYQLVISDSDGGNPAVLLSSPAPIMSPRFSPDGSQIAYVTFEGDRSQILVQNIFTGKRQLIANDNGMNSSPAWSPDGRKIALVQSKDGNPEIYYKELSSGKSVRVTDSKSIDTEPSWSPNGKYIYYTSNRNGSVQLYRINLRNGRVNKVTNSRYSAGVDVSSDGQKLALSRSVNGKFVVGVIDLNKNRFSSVSSGFTDETPRFSPNSKMLIFTTVKDGKSVLKIVNVDNDESNILESSGHIRDPDWSTYIK